MFEIETQPLTDPREVDSPGLLQQPTAPKFCKNGDLLNLHPPENLKSLI